MTPIAQNEVRESDEVLAVRAADGCLASFEQLVERFQVPLVHFLQRRIGSLEDAEDLVQETFVRAYQNLHRYESKWRFSTWVFTIARRLCINQQRRKHPKACTESAFAAPLAHVESPRAEPCDVLAAREESQKLWSRAAEVLSEPKFTALWLHYVEDLPIADIACVLGRSKVAVKTMMFRARQQLLPLVERETSTFQAASYLERALAPVETIRQRLLSSSTVVPEF